MMNRPKPPKISDREWKQVAHVPAGNENVYDVDNIYFMNGD